MRATTILYLLAAASAVFGVVLVAGGSALVGGLFCAIALPIARASGRHGAWSHVGRFWEG